MKRLLVYFTLLLCTFSAYAQCTVQINGKTVPCTTWEYYKPTSANVDQLPLIRVRISLHIIQKSDGSNNYQITDTPYLNNIFGKVNFLLAHIRPLVPYDSFNKSPIFGKCQIKYVINGIYFHKDDFLWGANKDNGAGPLILDTFVTKNASLDTFVKDSTIHVLLNMGGQWKGQSSGDKHWAWTPGTWGTYKDFQNHAIHPTHSDSLKDSVTGKDSLSYWANVKSLDSLNFWTDVQLFTHELGHCLGLAHVYFIPFSIEQAGDDCDDTPTGLSGETNNIMDYNFRNTWAFSSEQVGKMRMGLSGAFSSADCVIKDWCSYDALSTITIPSSTTAIWKSPRKLAGDIIVSNGATLSIQANVSMPTGGNIVVQPGGILDIENCTISNECGQRWGGIIVEADALGMTKTYGGAILINTTIENAECGLRLGSENASHWGGTAQGYGARFHNCRIGVWAQPDSGNYSGYGNQFDTCTFITDGNVPGYSHGTEIFVKLDGNTHYHFSGDSFVNTTTTSNVNRATGIKAVNSSFTIRNMGYDSTDAFGCEYPNQRTNIFKGLSTGVDFSGTGTVKILDAKFINVQRGINGHQNDGALIYNNNFLVDNGLLKYISGAGYHDTTINVDMDTCTRFDIKKNYFQYNMMTGLTGEYWHVAVYKCQADSNSHIRNDSLFVKNTTGAFGKGMFLDGNNSTLLINCNNFIGMDNDIYITSNASSSLGPQGTSSKGAGNQFSPGRTYDFNNLSGSNPDYWYESFQSRANPNTNFGSLSPHSLMFSDTSCPGIICWTVEPSRPFELKKAVDASLESYRLFPNPSNGKLTYEFEIPNYYSIAIFNIYDVNGRVMLNKMLSSGIGTINIDAGLWRPGMYFYRVTSMDKIINKGSIVINK